MERVALPNMVMDAQCQDGCRSCIARTAFYCRRRFAPNINAAMRRRIGAIGRYSDKPLKAPAKRKAVIRLLTVGYL